MATKFLVINHPEDANIKTILEYTAPPVAAGDGFLNFDDSDGDNTIMDIGPIPYAAQLVMVPFTYGGDSNAVDPVISQFSVGSNNPSYVTNETIALNSGAGTGMLSFNVGDNQGGSSSGRAIHIDYNGQVGHPSQIAGHWRVTVVQAGGTYIQK